MTGDNEMVKNIKDFVPKGDQHHHDCDDCNENRKNSSILYA